MALDEEHVWMLAGFFIVLVVGLNMIFVFGDIADISITGAVAANTNCKLTSGGIMCGKTLYPNTPATGVCPSNYVPVCTNVCELNSALSGKSSACQTPCASVCIPVELAKKL